MDGDYYREAVQLIKTYSRLNMWKEEQSYEEKLMEYFYLSGEGIVGLQNYLEQSKPDEAEINELFLKDLSFGTAGLRAAMGIGFNKMNLVSVALASMGIGAYLKEELGLTAGGNILIGYDHRHNSYAFARISKQIFEEYGHSVRLFEEPVPTPYVPSGIRCLGMDFGVMVTASHNPKEDNGYKVYHGRGAQIRDVEAGKIVRWIGEERGKRKQLIPNVDIDEGASAIGISVERGLIERVEEWFINNLKKSLNLDNTGKKKQLRFMYTAMHGVGAKYVERIFKAIFAQSSQSDLNFVEEQRYPDPDFPTIKYPNPEEGGETLRLALECAEREGIEVIFANDPDADRFLVAEQRKGYSGGNTMNDNSNIHERWRIFNGNEIATLLLDHISKTIHHCDDERSSAVLASCVSSRYLGKMCERRGWHFETTQTGFKNLGNRGLELESEGFRVLMAYEEAIGFQVGNWNFDKDGISTLMTFYTLLLKGAEDDCTLSERLDRIYREVGYFPMQFNGYFICKNPEKIKEIISKAQDNVALLDEHCKLKDVSRLVFKPQLLQQSSSNVISLEFTVDGYTDGWLMVRASGTEPKIKYYSEIMQKYKRNGDGNESIDQENMDVMIKTILEVLFKPSDW